MIFSINDIWGHNLADPDPSKNLLDCYSDPKFPFNPEQSLAVCIDLIDQGQVLVTNLPLDLIDTNGLNIR